MRHLNGAKFRSAPDQFRAKTAMVGVVPASQGIQGRFQIRKLAFTLQHICFATETTVEELKNCSKNENTAKSTGFWLAVWKNWCVDKEITDEIENYEPAELNTLLEHFYAEVNNKKGEDYESESLKVMMASLDRHLKNKGCTLSIVCDREFSSSKEVLENKAKQLRLAGRAW